MVIEVRPSPSSPSSGVQEGPLGAHNYWETLKNSDSHLLKKAASVVIVMTQADSDSKGTGCASVTVPVYLSENAGPESHALLNLHSRRTAAGATTYQASGSRYIDDTSRLEVSHSLELNVDKLRLFMTGKARPWSTCTGLGFDLPNFQPIHFVPPRAAMLSITAPSPSLSTASPLRLRPAPSFLGSCLTTSSPSAATSSSRRGATIVVPRMEYGLPVWYKPVSSNSDPRRMKVQRQACKLITVALRTTASDTLDFHANILPVHIRLNRSAFNAAARLASLPPSSPIHRIAQRCRRVPRFHRSPIHHLMTAFPIFRLDLEMIEPKREIPMAR
ncbi:hypothetical protein B0H14DRAFT_3437973 [Mycena olivaceomarginata]|nr:hypothetical protein B0H14DRAFT_3437973 [Mycena olivaceomarginata]